MTTLDSVLNFASEGMDVLVALAVTVLALAVVARVLPAAGWLLAAGSVARIAVTVLVRAQGLWAGSDPDRNWQMVLIVNRIAYLVGSLAFWASVAVAAWMLARRAGERR